MGVAAGVVTKGSVEAVVVVGMEVADIRAEAVVVVVEVVVVVDMTAVDVVVVVVMMVVDAVEGVEEEVVVVDIGVVVVAVDSGVVVEEEVVVVRTFLCEFPLRFVVIIVMMMMMMMMTELTTRVYSGSSGQIPEPDVKITELEDAWMKKHGISPQAKPGPQLETALARLTIKDPQSGLTQLPKRPAFGTNGTPIILWANYFRLQSKVDHLYRYDVRVMPKKLSPDEEKEASTTKKADDREIKGKKLAKIIEQALRQLKGNPTVATEYKQQVITLEKLKLSEDSFEEVLLTEAGRKPETWYVRFDGPTSIDIRGLTSHLLSLDDKDNDGAFPKYLAEIDSLGVVLGHGPRSDPGTAAVGRSRFFAVDDRADRASMPPSSLIDILRGYVQSVRPATGRLLLNTNVTHGVFRKEFPLVTLFKHFDLMNLHQPFSNQQAFNSARRDLEKLHKFLSKSRIRCKVPGNKPGEFVTSDRGMAGLAVKGDGGGESHKPEFTGDHRQRYGTPATVKFFLRAAPPPASPPPPGLKPDTMVTVEDYYRKSKWPLTHKVPPPPCPLRSFLTPPGQDTRCRSTRASRSSTSGHRRSRFTSWPSNARFSPASR